MLVVWEEHNLGDSACVFLQVRDQLLGSDLPDSDFSLHASRANELAVAGEADSSDATLMSVVDLPKELTVVYSVGSDLSIAPS